MTQKKGEPPPPRLFKERRRRTWILGGILAACALGGLAVWLGLNSDAMKPDREQAHLDGFDKMSPSEHLAEAKKLLESSETGSGRDAVRHLNAIPKSAPEYRDEQVLEGRAFARMARETRAANEASGISGGFGDALGGIWLLSLIIGAALLYIVPSWVGRNKRNSSAIVALNLLLGWTFVGWVVALVWALTSETPALPIAVNQATPPSVGAPVLCIDCGKYSLPGSKFCSGCGARFA
jgi:Superinfection immunity protein